MKRSYIQTQTVTKRNARECESARLLQVSRQTFNYTKSQDSVQTTAKEAKAVIQGDFDETFTARQQLPIILGAFP